MGVRPQRRDGLCHRTEIFVPPHVARDRVWSDGWGAVWRHGLAGKDVSKYT